MEFHAYPSQPQGGKASSLRTLWRAQGLLHSSDSVLIPAALLLTGVCMALYQHMTSNNDNSIRNFLVMILVSMFPLALLEKKLFACADPLGLLSKFSTKVVMMYACFLSYRVIAPFAIDGSNASPDYRNSVLVVAAYILLPTVFGLRATRSFIWEHRDVLCVVVVTLLTAIITELLEVFMEGYANSRFMQSAWYRKKYIRLICVAASDYTEILSFVPAMWMVCRADKDATVKHVDVPQAQRRAVALFAFLISFYVFEDVGNAYTLRQFAPLASAGHIAHFLLVLDFAAFILAHLYDPEKYDMLVRSLCKMVRECSMV